MLSELKMGISDLGPRVAPQFGYTENLPKSLDLYISTIYNYLT